MKRKFEDFTKSLLSLLKVILLSKRCHSLSQFQVKDGDNLIILGNGPSLRETIDKNSDILLEYDLMAVNFAANAPEFVKLRPKYYVLADGHFFKGVTSDPNVKNLWRNLSNTSWPITLFIPAKYRHLVSSLIIDARNVHLSTFNLTPIEGLTSISHFLFNIGAGMPRPRNVMIPAIMEGIRMGYNKIYLCGADHSWTKTLDVDEENFVISIQPHFYSDNENEKQRVRETYKGIRLHEVLGSMSIAFRSYCEIAEYAKRKKVEIINATPGSMIDAFKRGKLQ